MTDELKDFESRSPDGDQPTAGATANCGQRASHEPARLGDAASVNALPVAEGGSEPPDSQPADPLPDARLQAIHQLIVAIRRIEDDAICTIDMDCLCQSEVDTLKAFLRVLQDYAHGYDEDEPNHPRLSVDLLAALQRYARTVEQLEQENKELAREMLKSRSEREKESDERWTGESLLRVIREKELAAADVRGVRLQLEIDELKTEHERLLTRVEPPHINPSTKRTPHQPSDVAEQGLPEEI